MQAKGTPLVPLNLKKGSKTCKKSLVSRHLLRLTIPTKWLLSFGLQGAICAVDTAITSRS